MTLPIAPEEPTINVTDGLKWMDDHFLEFIGVDVLCNVTLVGSLAINGVGNDIDILVQTELREAMESFLFQQGFVAEGEEDYPVDEFTSMRKDNVNVLVVSDLAFYDKWERSVDVCRFIKHTFGSCTKEVRVAIHQKIMDAR